MLTLRLIFESFGFAWKALKSNLLRTILSLLGVTVGIFAIIAVFTFVDSLEKNVKDSLNFLGTNVIYVQKWPFPGNSGQFKWWDYLKRPTVSVNEYKVLQEKLTSASAMTLYAWKGNVTVKRGSSSIGQIILRGAGQGYESIYEVPIEQGRFLTLDEMEDGRNVVVIGFEVAKALFPNGNMLGQSIKLSNVQFKIVGLIKREGESFLGTPSNDYSVLIPYNAFRKLYQTGTGVWSELGSAIGVKGFPTDVGLVELENEVRGLMRSRRGLGPSMDDNFSLNRPEAITNMISGVFDVLSLAGWFIGGFSMLIGGFGIANIMFVSVKERTAVIGLQKSLGAKNYFILFQFLFESVFLSLIGGLAGLILVYFVTFIPLGDLVIGLSVKNITLGIGFSSFVGVVAGIIPAALAARLDPVDALRSV